MCTWIVCRVILIRQQPDFDGLFQGFLAVMIISSCKMAAKGEKADYHLRLVQIKLRKNVCKSLWTKCASISNYLIHVMLSYLLCSLSGWHTHKQNKQTKQISERVN